ncbi:MAG: class I SAM-dependent methyltransferase [Chloroflexota bacterium]
MARNAAPAANQIVRAVLYELFDAPSTRSFNVRLWDDTTDGPARRDTPFTLVIRRPGALRRMFLPPSELALGEAYLRDDFDVEGSFEAAASLADGIAARLTSPRRIARLLRLLRYLPVDDLPGANAPQPRSSALRGRRHSQVRDAIAVRSHYDVGNDFYALWLDQRMIYSCAYFRHENDSLDVAQEAKLDLICRKLRLQAGETLLDIGCGWGGLIQHAARHYGVIATGITLSESQASIARSRIAAHGLSERCKVEVRDYRDVDGQTFDKVVSVGMYEHVGRAKMPVYFSHARQLTAPGGLFLNHGIVTGPVQFTGLAEWARARVWREGSFVQKYVFPDGDVLTPGEIVIEAEKAGFEARDVENLREHYALTLRHWVHRLEERRDDAVRLVGEETYRVWRLYMSAYAMAFATGRVGITQTLLSRTGRDGICRLPLTREDLYADNSRPGIQTVIAHAGHASS